jgi:hypothetical protein
VDLAQVTAVFGWMLVINLGVYLLAAAVIVFAGRWAARFEARITGVPVEDWPGIFVDYLSRYKIAIMVFNVAPYVALRIVS